MPKVQPNFNDLFKPEPGEYLCKIEQTEIKVGRNSGTQYVSWKLKTQPGNATIFYNTPVEGRGAGLFKHMVHCAGDRGYDGGEYDTDSLIGQMVFMKLDVEEQMNRNGETQTYFKVSKVSAPPVEELDKLNQMRNLPNEGDLPF